MEKSRIQDLCIGGLFFLIAAWAFIQTLSMPEGEVLYARVVLLLLLAFSAMLIASAVYKRNVPGGALVRLSQLEAPLVSTIIIIGYCIIIPVTGFYSASVVFMLAFMWYLGTRSLKSMLLTVGCLLVFIYFLFTIQLSVPLPKGFLL
jgi:hypothetical protein